MVLLLEVCVPRSSTYTLDMVEAAAGRAATEMTREFNMSPLGLESECLKLAGI